MVAPNFQKMFGGVVPGGVITITPATPIKVTANLKLASGSQSLNVPATPPYTVTCRQIGFSVDATPSGEVYVNYGPSAGKGNNTALIIQSGTTVALPVNSRCTEGEIDANAWYVDGSAACVVAISFVDASS
ncbi:MAG TPA: hypothetical protein VN666_21925 [Nitrospira sp.]|nr:hypothetical protein [Nitrospira sp.]